MNIEELTRAWSTYLATADWRALIEGVEAKSDGCGDLYEIDNPIERANESFAIADMRNLDVAKPHKHINGEIEIYFILEGTGRVFVGDDESFVGPGDVIVTPPGTVHYTVPQDQLVMAVVNTPPFEADNVVWEEPKGFAKHASREIETRIAHLLEVLVNKLDAWAAVVLSPNVKGDLLGPRARYNLPLDWAVLGNRLDSGSHNATAYNNQTEEIDNNVNTDQSPTPNTTPHKMTATAIVLIPGAGTLEVLADTDDYKFDESSLELMRQAAAEIAELVS